MRVRLLGAAVGVALVLAGFGAFTLTQSSHDARAQVDSAPPPLVSRGEFAQLSGVRITHLAVTGDGGLVDLRYQVVDSNAANSIHDPQTPPQLVDERSHVVVHDLLMNHAHHGQLKVAHTYYLIFTNPGNLLRAGTRVTVQLGAARLAHVPVQ